MASGGATFKINGNYIEGTLSGTTRVWDFPNRNANVVSLTDGFNVWSCKIKYRDISTSLKVNTPKLDLSVYPNPFTTDIKVNSSEKSIINISDINGRVVLTENIEIGSNTIPVENLPIGIYIAQVGDKKLKLIKQ